LVRAFLDSATAHFGFLASAHGLAVTTETSMDMQGIVRYTGTAVIVEVKYADDRDHYLTVTVGRPVAAGAAKPVLYGLWRWLDALGVKDRRMTAAAGLWTPESIDRVNKDAAGVLRDVLPGILAAGPDVRRAMDDAEAADRRYYALPLEQRRTD
jgi:hypothetical protein